jgi:hypothetical protein
MNCLQQRLAIQSCGMWDGHLARACIISGLFVPHHKKFWDIFLIGSLLKKSGIFLFVKALATR